MHEALHGRGAYLLAEIGSLASMSMNSELASELRLPRLERRNTSICRPPDPAEAAWRRPPQPSYAESVRRAPSEARLAVMKLRLQQREA